MPLAAHPLGEALQADEVLDLGLQLGDGPGGRGLVHDLLFGCLHLGGRRVLDVVGLLELVVQAFGGIEGRLGGPAEELLFPEPLLQPLAAAAEGFGNGVG